MASPSLVVLYFTWLVYTTSSQDLSASAVLDQDNNFNLSLSINATKGIISMIITGPDSKWFGIGFGNTVMTDTYAIVCSKDASSHSICQENKLSKPGATGYGEHLSQTIHISSDHTHNHIRKVHITRNITIHDPNYFSFPTSSRSLNIIFAIGSSDSFTSLTSSMGPGASTALFLERISSNNVTVDSTSCGAKITINKIVVFPDQDAVQLNVSAPANVWFGIGFNSSSMGPTTYAIVCNTTYCAENYITGHSYGTSLTSTIKIVSSSIVNNKRHMILTRKRNITASESADFAHYFVFPGNDTTIPIIYAVGTNNIWSEGSIMSFNGSTFGTTSIAFKRDTNNDTLCKAGVKYYGTKGDLDDGFTVGLHIYCASKSIRLSIEYSHYSRNWFGIVFNTQMVPSSNATVFTTGKKSETQRALALYAYDLGAKAIDDVVYHKERDWKKVSQSVIGGKVSLLYEQQLNNTKWSIFTKEITFRYAYGAAQSTVLQQHASSSTSKVWTFNLESGSISSSGSNTIKTVHGIIMILSWSLLTTFGIFSSRYREILYHGAHNKATWFLVHRGVQSSVVILVLTGFGIAVYFTQNDGEKHISNTHECFGLTVVILAVLQPINAWFRPHPPQKGESKSRARVLWEMIHKPLGYIAWCLAQYAIYLGIAKLTSNAVYSTVFVWWVAAVIAVYLILGIYDACCFTNDTQSRSQSGTQLFDESDKGLLSSAVDANVSPNQNSIGPAPSDR